MRVAALHSAPSSPHVGWIEFGSTRRGKRGWDGAVSMSYDGDEWTIEIDMIDHYADATVAFFDGIAEKGWNDVRRWRSEFAEVELDASNLGNGVVCPDFHFWWSRGSTLDNEREGQLHVRADALHRFAEQIRALMQGD